MSRHRAVTPARIAADLTGAAADLGYTLDQLHPGVRRPLIAPPGWDDLALAASIRRALMIPQGTIAVAMRRHTSDVSAWECGRAKTITPEMLTSYLSALVRAAEVREDRLTGKVRELAGIARSEAAPGAWVDRLLDQVEAGAEGGRHA